MSLVVAFKALHQDVYDFGNGLNVAAWQKHCIFVAAHARHAGGGIKPAAQQQGRLTKYRIAFVVAQKVVQGMGPDSPFARTLQSSLKKLSRHLAGRMPVRADAPCQQGGAWRVGARLRHRGGHGYRRGQYRRHHRAFLKA